MSNRRILDNFHRLTREHPTVRPRIPLIPGINDDEANLDALGGSWPRRACTTPTCCRITPPARLDWIARLQGRGVYTGVQAEWIDWVGGMKFSFGASSQGARINPVDCSIATAKELGLTRKDMFQPAPRGRKPIQVRKLRA